MVAIGVAVLARTQFYALAAVLPAVLVADALVGRRFRAALREHVALVVVYIVGAVAALALAATGHGLLGTYAQTARGNPLPREILESAPSHLAVVALAGGLIPFLVGGAWAVSNLLRIDRGEGRAFAWLTVVTVVVLTVEVASFVLRFGGGLVRERYLFYLTPLLLCAFAAALSAPRLPRWSLLVPLSILTVGFWRAPITAYEKLNVDTPASVLYDWLLTTMQGTAGTRVALVLASVVICLIVVEGGLSAAPRAVRGRALRAPAGRPAGGDRLRVQAPLRRQRDVRAAADARPERRVRLGRPDDHDDVRGDDGAVPRDPRRLLGEHRLLVGLRVLEQVGRPRGGAAESVLGHAREAFPSSTSASTRGPAFRTSTSTPTSRRPSGTCAST